MHREMKKIYVITSNGMRALREYMDGLETMGRMTGIDGDQIEERLEKDMTLDGQCLTALRRAFDNSGMTYDKLSDYPTQEELKEYPLESDAISEEPYILAHMIAEDYILLLEDPMEELVGREFEAEFANSKTDPPKEDGEYFCLIRVNEFTLLKKVLVWKSDAWNTDDFDNDDVMYLKVTD